jgi:glycosyltransferase involved in cell wall biosynthesis
MPRVSVIIPAFYSAETLPRCLAGLRQQRFRDFEVILINSSPEAATSDLARHSFPEVRFEQSPVRLLPHAARNAGVRVASGEILVFTDPDCYMRPDALEQLVAAQDSGRLLVGGAIENACGGWWELGVHLAKFAWWLPGSRAATRPDLPTAIAAYSRSIWNEIGPFDDETWCGDSMFVQRFIRRSGVAWFEPTAIVDHHHLADVSGFVRERYARGVDYGKGRTHQNRWGRFRIALQLGLFPVLPWLMTARSLRYAASSGRLGDAVVTAPIILAGNTAWCFGEAVTHARLLFSK